ncbi:MULTISPECIES: TetR/AcrR family transcriptional regulator [Clostridium]|uniref:Transcriptional regulator, TetR family n=1 Tax=Clostridium cadaveris TaxID=1529 RepID=A0A1I2K6F1_9CLOT|nr:TetR/AcrR family transcriptional regulator [Clostridium cadaveris]MDU4950880.1 TetR/AcrR family transcriptional regulator [Clostridium sp.]MDM8310879.1 TetR/AcrR family transcriptional regulator [Clostridium cadaveris]MDY4949172.1 TetR/AcrR family transcriptional regulator [Clostridium cadaveris]NME63371.1 TetR/AcrR family transcriptional regulator [Clostridium cadaveris]SFF61993.1 transcriptional regulator, TetR family [Clostridium cadaveris]
MAAPRKDNVQKLIIETTEKLLETQKLSDIPFSQIAKGAGISKGTLYYHYKSKNDILFDIMDKYLSKQFDDLITWTENPNKDTSLHRLVKYVLERDISNANMRLHFFYDAMLGNEEVRVKLLKRYEDFAKIISEKIEERTSIMSADYLAWLLLLLSDGLFIHKTLNNENLDVTKFITQSEELMKMFSNSISDFDSK